MTRPVRQIRTTETTTRIAKDIAGAIRRRPNHEERLAGIVRSLATLEPEIQEEGAKALDVLISRGSTDRPLYAALTRALAVSGYNQAPSLIARALGLNEAGGYPALSAACFLDSAELTTPLVQIASTRHPHLSFAAEVARLARGEADGAHLTTIAPRIKESHRIALCAEVFVPLLHAPPLPKTIGPSLDILRGAERHLGRWLVFAEISVKAGNDAALEQARDKANSGTSSAKNAWNLVSWALSYDAPPPSTRPNNEIVARLSDRPSAKRDTTFLFRMADAGATSAHGMLEGLIKQMPLSTEVAVRAAGYLVRDNDRPDLLEALIEATKNTKQDELRGFATAVLWDAGRRDEALDHARALKTSRSLRTATWSTLVSSAADQDWTSPLVTEENFRHIQLGCVV